MQHGIWQVFAKPWTYLGVSAEPFSQQLVERADEPPSMEYGRILPNPGHICECQLNHFHSSLWKGLMSHPAWNMAGFCQTLDISVSVS